MVMKSIENLQSLAKGFVLITCIAIFCWSCNSRAIFDQSKSIPATGWDARNKIRFEVPVTDTAAIYNFYLNIRHTTSYRYSNIYFFITTFFPDGKVGRDTVECVLADPTGKWFGKGITNLKDNQVLLRGGIRFPRRGTYVFEFEQAMRRENLEGIRDIGLRLEKI
jgi:gliding motility-associated lipoprotein GldH